MTMQSKVFILSKSKDFVHRQENSTTNSFFNVEDSSKSNALTSDTSVLGDDESKPEVSLFYQSAEVTVILQGTDGMITCLAANPNQSRIIVGTDKGVIQIWDYNIRTLILSRAFHHQIPVKKEGSKKKEFVNVETISPIKSFTFSKSGKTLAVGFETGTIKFLDSQTLDNLTRTEEEKTEAGYAVSLNPITKIAFSNDGNYCAASDSEHATIIFRKEVIKIKNSVALPLDSAAADSKSQVRSRVEWVYIGRRKTHFQTIVALLFLEKNGSTKLFSVSKDRHVAEYNLVESTPATGIVVHSIRRIEQLYQPESAIIYQKTGSNHPEDFIMTFNTGGKFKLFAVETQLCRSISLGPTFGDLVHEMALIPTQSESKFMAFATDNIIGLAKLPLDGNPFKYTGIIGHPAKISNLVVSSNGSNLFSSGGPDGILNMWSTQPYVLEQQIVNGGDDMVPFLNMLDPSKQGCNGPIYTEFQDFFFYTQLKM